MYRREWGIAESVLLVIIVFLIFSSLFVFSVIKALRSGILPVAVDLVCGKRCSEDVEAPVIEIVKLPWEIITVRGIPGIAVEIESSPVFRTVEDVRAYANNRSALLKLIAEKKGDMVVEAIIQPIKPLTVEEYLQLVTKYNVTVLAFGHWSYPDGGGRIVIHPEDLGDPLPEEVFTWCESIKESLRRLHGDTYRGVPIDQFVCIYRISGITVRAKLKELIKVNEDPLVLTVDLGPLLVAEQYRDIVEHLFMKWEYIWHYIPDELRDEYAQALSK